MRAPVTSKYVCGPANPLQAQPPAASQAPLPLPLYRFKVSLSVRWLGNCILMHVQHGALPISVGASMGWLWVVMLLPACAERARAVPQFHLISTVDLCALLMVTQLVLQTGKKTPCSCMSLRAHCQANYVQSQAIEMPQLSGSLCVTV